LAKRKWRLKLANAILAMKKSMIAPFLPAFTPRLSWGYTFFGISKTMMTTIITG